MPSDSPGAPKKLGDRQLDARCFLVLTTQRAYPLEHLSPQERHEIAVNAAQTRWNRKRRQRLRQLHQTGQAAIKAYVALKQDLERHPSAENVARLHQAHRLLSAFSNLWELAGHKPTAELLAAMNAELPPSADEPWTRKERNARH
jgi:hypothetical protein